MCGGGGGEDDKDGGGEGQMRLDQAGVADLIRRHTLSDGWAREPIRLFNGSPTDACKWGIEAKRTNPKTKTPAFVRSPLLHT